MSDNYSVAGTNYYANTTLVQNLVAKADELLPNWVTIRLDKDGKMIAYNNDVEPHLDNSMWAFTNEDFNSGDEYRIINTINTQHITLNWLTFGIFRTTDSTVHTDCRSADGVTVGLIDSIIYIARVLRTHNLNTSNVVEALKDLRSDEDVRHLLNG